VTVVKVAFLFIDGLPAFLIVVINIQRFLVGTAVVLTMVFVTYKRMIVIAMKAGRVLNVMVS
jgi:hypothetical protein